MDRGGAEDSHALALALLYLKPLGLYDDTQTLDEEDSAKDRKQEFLMNNDGTDTDDTADRQGTGVSHEHLCGIGVVPKETNHRTDEGTEEDDQFLGAGDIHDVEIGSIDNMAADIRED